MLKLMRVEEAAESLGLGRTKMYALMAEGRIPVVRIDGCTRLRPEDVERFAHTCLDDGRGRTDAKAHLAQRSLTR